MFLSGCKSTPKKAQTKTEKDIYIKGVFITQNEIKPYLVKNTKKSIKGLANELDGCGITDVFLQTRAYGESLAKIKSFPQLSYAKSLNFDVLSYIIKTFKEKSIRTHIWINPLRIKTDGTDKNELNKESPVYKVLSNSDTEDDSLVCFTENGIYLNPASDKAVGLITEEVREIINKYKPAGISFDDYFYPTADESFDSESYGLYKSLCESPLSLSEWRIANINSLISSVYTAVKFCDKDTLFTVSPAASAKRSKEELFADVYTWCKNGCIDIIIPQLYFGFNYPDKNYSFLSLLSFWDNLSKETDTKTASALATYKIGTDSPPDKEEWADGKSVIKKETDCIRKDKTQSGYVYFSLTSFRKYKNLS